MAKVEWFPGDAVTVDGDHAHATEACEKMQTTDVIHATERVEVWHPSVRHVICIRVTYGSGALYVRPVNAPVNCIACLATGYRGS